MNHDNYYNSGYEALLKECNELDCMGQLEQLEMLRLRAEKFGGMKFMRFGNNVRVAAKDVVTLAWFYNHTGDAQLLNKMLLLMRYISNLSEWLFQGKTDGFFHADLWTGDICADMAYAYLLTKDSLSPQDSKIITSAIEKKGIEPIYKEWLAPETHKHAFDSMGHNWWSVIVGGALVGVLALGQKCRNYDVYYSAMTSGLREWFGYPGNVLQNKKANFGKDGDYVEYLGYLCYALSNYVIAEDLLRQAGNTELFEEEKLGGLINYYMLFLQTLKSGVHVANFGDTSVSISGNTQTLFYLASRFNRPDLLRLVKQSYREINSVFDLVFYPDAAIEDATVKAPCEGVFNASGYAVMRSGYTPEDWFFAMKAGESWNHNHRDIGTFILSAKGREFIVDSGTCCYSKPEYMDYYTTARAHNTVIFDGEGQHPDSIYCGTKFGGNFPAHLFTPEFRYLLCDGTGPLMNVFQRYYRHVMMFENILLIVDDLHAYHAGTFNWLLHFYGNIKDEENNFTIENDGEQVTLCPLFPQEKSVSFTDGYYTEQKRDINDDGILPPAEYLQIDCETDEKNRAKIMNAFVLPYGEKPVFSTAEENKMLITKLQFSQFCYTVYCNQNADGRIMHFNGLSECDSLYTDAFLTVVKTARSGELLNLSMINGSILRWKGETMISSLLKLDCCLNFANRKADVNASTETRLHLNCNGLKQYAVSAGENQIRL